MVTANRDGGLANFELTGMLSLRITDEQMAKIRMQLDVPNKTIQLQTHPNIDKELLKSRYIINGRNTIALELLPS